MRITAALISSVLLACVRPVAATHEPAGRAPAATTSCAIVEGDRLGQLPLTIQVGDVFVRFAEWTLPDALATGAVGFAADLPADVTFTVRAGGEDFSGTGARWLNPYGVDGPRVHPIERITFCRRSSPARLALGLPAPRVSLR
jgi:hypothetical protein